MATQNNQTPPEVTLPELRGQAVNAEGDMLVFVREPDGSTRVIGVWNNRGISASRLRKTSLSVSDGPTVEMRPDAVALSAESAVRNWNARREYDGDPLIAQSRRDLLSEFGPQDTFTESRRDFLLRYARLVYNLQETGLNDTPFNDIASAAGVSTQTVRNWHAEALRAGTLIDLDKRGR